MSFLFKKKKSLSGINNSMTKEHSSDSKENTTTTAQHNNSEYKESSSHTTSRIKDIIVPTPPEHSLSNQLPHQPPSPSHNTNQSTETSEIFESEVSEEILTLRKYFNDLQLTRRLVKDIFHIGDTLGTGTFGRVRLVTHFINTKKLYFALKMLKKSEIIRLKQVEHIKSEKLLLSSICHPFIVNLYTSFQDDTHLFMLMEYVIGGELFSQLRKVGRFSNDTSKFYAAEIVLALQYLHSKNIAYRDLKPENLLIDREGHIKITDFGFAKIVEDRTWTLCGTPEYLAPEIIQSKGHGRGYPPFYCISSSHAVAVWTGDNQLTLRTAGEINVGDMLVDDKGKPTKVTEIDRGNAKLLTVTFGYGSTVRVTENHDLVLQWRHTMQTMSTANGSVTLSWYDKTFKNRSVTTPFIHSDKKWIIGGSDYPTPEEAKAAADEWAASEYLEGRGRRAGSTHGRPGNVVGPYNIIDEATNHRYGAHWKLMVDGKLKQHFKYWSYPNPNSNQPCENYDDALLMCWNEYEAQYANTEYKALKFGDIIKLKPKDFLKLSGFIKKHLYFIKPCNYEQFHITDDQFEEVDTSSSDSQHEKYPEYIVMDDQGGSKFTKLAHDRFYKTTSFCIYNAINMEYGEQHNTLNPNFIIKYDNGWRNIEIDDDIKVLILLDNPLNSDEMWANAQGSEAFTMRNVRKVLEEVAKQFPNAMRDTAVMDLIPFVGPRGSVDAAGPQWTELCQLQYELIWEICPDHIIVCGSSVSSRIHLDHTVEVLKEGFDVDMMKIFRNVSSSSSADDAPYMLVSSVKHPCLLPDLPQLYKAVANAFSLMQDGTTWTGDLPEYFSNTVNIHAFRTWSGKRALITNIETEEKETPYTGITVESESHIFMLEDGWLTGNSESPFGIYQKILEGKLDFPKHFDPNAKDLVKRLLTSDRTKRFGCLKDGAEDIKRHKWFKGIDWTKCFYRQLRPPYLPGFTSPDDTSNFDKYPDSRDNSAIHLSSKEKELFADF